MSIKIENKTIMRKKIKALCACALYVLGVTPGCFLLLSFYSPAAYANPEKVIFKPALVERERERERERE